MTVKIVYNKIKLFEKDLAIIVTKQIDCERREENSFHIIDKSAEIRILGTSLISIEESPERNNAKNANIDLVYANRFLTLLEAFSGGALKKHKTSLIIDIGAGQENPLYGFGKYKETLNLQLCHRGNEVFLNPFEVDNLQRVVRSVLRTLGS